MITMTEEQLSRLLFAVAQATNQESPRILGVTRAHHIACISGCGDTKKIKDIVYQTFNSERIRR